MRRQQCGCWMSLRAGGGSEIPQPRPSSCSPLPGTARVPTASTRGAPITKAEMPATRAHATDRQVEAHGAKTVGTHAWPRRFLQPASPLPPDVTEKRELRDA